MYRTGLSPPMEGEAVDRARGEKLDVQPRSQSEKRGIEKPE
jgi:hypothetical protein